MSVREVNAKTDLGPTPKGGSGSHYFLCGDDQEYIVKFDQSKQKTIINELVAISLAREMNLPAPEVTIVNISQEFLDDATAELKKKKIQAGKHVGIKRLPKKTWDLDYWKDEMLKSKNLTNQNDLFGVVSFDNWIINTDRDNAGNNMLELLEDNKIRYWMVDFGHCFLDNNWNIERLMQESKKQNLMNIYKFIKEKIDNIQDFLKWFETIEKIKDEKIKEIVDYVPPSWLLSREEKLFLTEFIQQRKVCPRKIICNKKGDMGIAN